jgi:carbamoyltransferase
VIHADGTGRLQIVRKEADPLAHAYLKALGRRNGEEVADWQKAAVVAGLPSL